MEKTNTLPNEQARLEALRKYNILDTLTEKDYEQVTHLASMICQVPIALISFLDMDRQWFKSHPGIEASEMPREYSFCAHALLNPHEAMIVTDSRVDERFSENPYVTGEPRIIFYAGIPLVDKEGFGLGTVCVLDTKVRRLTAQQLKALHILSTQVMHLLELRRSNYELQTLKIELETRNKDLEQFAMVLTHDIKSPLSGVMMAQQMLIKKFGAALGTEGTKLLESSSRTTAKIKELVDGILSYYKGETDAAHTEPIRLHDFFSSLSKVLVSPNPLLVHYDFPDALVTVNKILLEQVFFNLINNSIRYNDKATVEIAIDFSEDPDYYLFSVRDNGIGIPADKLDSIFDLFTTVATKDRFGARGHGIGLPTVKKIIESYDGKIEVRSELTKGTTFDFSLKKINRRN